MRVYIPRLPGEITSRGSLPPGTRLDAFGVRTGAGAAATDPEELEYEAMLTAAFTAVARALATDPGSRVAVLAADSPVVAGPDADGRVEVVVGADFHPVSVHVSELGAAAIEADENEPGLLWFDISETAAAAAFARRSS